MKQSLILSLCVAMLAAFGISAAQADVDVALNIRYNDPADPNEGATWSLVALSDTASSTGITGLVARFNAGTIVPTGTVEAGIGHDINGGTLVSGSFVDPNGPDYEEFVYGQDPNDGLTANVGLVGGPTDQGADPLRNPVWDNASLIATGTIAGGVRPTALLAAANEEIGGNITLATIGNFSVRGDAAESLGIEAAGTGLLAGDINRDGDVTTGDLSVLLGNFNDPPGSQGWADGDFTDDGDVATGDLSLLLGNFNAPPTNPGPPIGAVPEPASIVLLLAGAGFGLLRRKV